MVYELAIVSSGQCPTDLFKNFVQGDKELINYLIVWWARITKLLLKHTKYIYKSHKSITFLWVLCNGQSILWNFNFIMLQIRLTYFLQWWYIVYNGFFCNFFLRNKKNCSHNLIVYILYMYYMAFGVLKILTFQLYTSFLYKIQLWDISSFLVLIIINKNHLI